VSGTEGRTLPKEISTETGAYKISDDAKYYQGDTVVRKDSPADDTVYEVYDDEGNLKNSWVLTWDSTSKKIDSGDGTFVGTWRYVPAPRLVIVKELKNDPDQFTGAHGAPSFCFRITGASSGKSWYKSITFSDDAIDAVKKNGTYKGPEGTQFVLKNGIIYGTCASVYLPEDDYTVEEISTLRFKEDQVQARYHGDEAKLIGTGAGAVTVPLRLSSYHPGDTGFDAVYASVAFQNSKIRWDKFSHMDIRINKLKGAQ